MPFVISGSGSGNPVYTDLATVKNTLELSSETFADADITVAITAASRAIEKLCRRRFWLDPDANQVRYYNATSHRVVRIDDLVTLTELATGYGQDTFDVIWTENTQFILEPMNAPSDGWPFTRIRAVYNHFPHQRRAVRVTGQFGWSTVPDEIVAATAMLATRLFRRAREAPFGIIGFALDAGTTAATRIARQDPDVMGLIGPFIRQLVA